MVTARVQRAGRGGVSGQGHDGGSRDAWGHGPGRVVRAAAPLVALLVLTACSASPGTSGDDDASGGPAASASAEQPSASASPDDDGSDDGTDDSASGSDDDDMGSDDAATTAVAVATTSLGDVLVDAQGMTLYMFDKDEQGGASTCYDQCATAWPPLLAEGTPGAGDGADDSRLGTVARTDGTMQVTYDGWPLYLWAQDAAAGDVTGQGVNDVWWVLTADGEPVRG